MTPSHTHQLTSNCSNLITQSVGNSNSFAFTSFWFNTSIGSPQRSNPSICIYKQIDYCSTICILHLYLSCNLLVPLSLLLLPAIQIKFISHLADQHFMATTDLENKSSTPPPPPADVDYSKVDVILRILLLAASVEVLAVIVSGDQTEQLLFQDVLVPQPAKFKY